MTDKPDTSREAVEQTASFLGIASTMPCDPRVKMTLIDAGAKLRALLAERDAAQFEARHYHKTTDNLARAMTKEIDAAFQAGYDAAFQAGYAAGFDRGWDAGAEAMREAAAMDADCGCAHRGRVLAAETKADQARACGAACCALAAASIRALPIPERQP